MTREELVQEARLVSHSIRWSYDQHEAADVIEAVADELVRTDGEIANLREYLRRIGHGDVADVIDENTPFGIAGLDAVPELLRLSHEGEDHYRERIERAKQAEADYAEQEYQRYVINKEDENAE